MVKIDPDKNDKNNKNDIIIDIPEINNQICDIDCQLKCGKYTLRFLIFVIICLSFVSQIIRSSVFHVDFFP